MAAGGSSKDLKAAIKKAKEAIKGKDFQHALEHSKVALSFDPKHYNALIFLGKSATELGQGDEAEQAYRKAAEIDPNQVLAWQGLCALYEKIDTPKNLEQLVEVYQQLMKHLGDEAKEIQTTEKLADLYQKLSKSVEACQVLHTLILKSGDSAYKMEKWTRIIKILSQQKSLDESSAGLLSEAYSVVLDSCSIEDESLTDFYRGYIDFQLKSKTADLALLKATCSKMHEKFPAEVFPSEKMAEITLIETYELKTSSDWSVYNELFELDSGNGWTLTGQGQMKLASGDFKTAKEHLSKATQKLPSFPLGWFFSAQCQLSLHDYQAAEQSAKQGRKLLKTYQHPALSEELKLNEAFRVLQGKSLLDSGLMADGLRAVELFKKLLPEAADKTVIYKLLTQAHLLAGDIASAQQSFEMISGLDESDTTALDGWLRFHQGDLCDAQKKLQAALGKEEKSVYHYWLGRVYWAMGGQERQDKSKCLSSLLKAAKLDPNYSDSFLYIGHHYMQISNDTLKAKRCYKKAYDLNPANEAAAQALGDACDMLDEKDEAIAVYAAVTQQAPLGGAKWAWLRLGLVQLKAGNPVEAVESFQAVLRADPNDIHSQECLAEAYLSRGSNTAALKTFSRVVEMDPNSTYALFKIGHIKQSVGLYSEAVSDYQEILSKTPDYVPALSGQGETYILMAKAALHEFFNARALSYIQNAVTVLTRAVLLHPDLCGLWKLLGDACTLIAPLHDNLIRISVSGALTSGNEKSCETLGKGELLALGGNCYARAVQRQRDCSSLWHDLGLNYYHQYQHSHDKKIAHKAMQFIQKAIKLDETNHLHWTALGVIAASKAFDDPRLSQHAFIKSIQLEAKNVVAWTNLGTLYLTHGNLKLANEAFAAAQSLEPSYVQSWIGQSMLAETLGSHEALDLYRHTTELTTHVEGGLGYADMVCSTILNQEGDKDSESYRYNIVQMGAVPTATAAVGKVADRLQVSGEAHTLHGILQERQGLHRAAEEAYSKALQVAKHQGDKEQINTALSNHGRALSSIGEAEEARDTIHSISPLVNVQDILQLALALYRNKEWQGAYMAYEQALQLMASDSEKSQILTTMAMVSCQSGDWQNAKTLLFKSSQLSAPCHQGLVALCALGLQTEDMVLANAALDELAKQPYKQDLVHHTVVLTSALHCMKVDLPGSTHHLMTSVKEYPEDSHLLNLAAELMLVLDPTNTKAISTCSAEAVNRGPTLKNVFQAHAAAKVCSGCHGNPSRGRLSPSLIAAQKAVHAMPGDMNNWALLGACCSAQVSWQQVHHKDWNLADLNHKLAEFLLKTSQADQKLAAWVSLHNVFCLLQGWRWDEAKKLSKQLLEWCDYGSEINASLTLFHYLGDWMQTRKQGTCSLESIRSTVTTSQSALAWQTLGKIYSESKMLAAAEACYKQCLALTSGQRQITVLHQLAYLAISGLKAGDESESWSDLAQQTVEEITKRAPKQPISHLLKGLIYKHLGNNDRQSRREMQQGMESDDEKRGQEDYTQSIIRVHLVEALLKKDKKDAEAQKHVKEAVEGKDPFSARLQELVSA